MSDILKLIGKLKFIRDHECKTTAEVKAMNDAITELSKQPEQRWIPCTPDTMPDDLEEVYVTWVNHNPPWYYTEIKDKPFTAPAVYHRGKWYWYSSVCVDALAEYGKNDVDEVDKDIEIVAWCKMPEPYGGEQK